MKLEHFLGVTLCALLPFGAAHGAGSAPQKEVVASKDAPAAVGPYSQAMDNLKAVLAAAGMTLDNVVSTTVYVKDLNDFTKLNTVYGTYFKDRPPARATVQVQRLPKDAAVEISAIAVP